MKDALILGVTVMVAVVAANVVSSKLQNII